jgi:metal-responsive CopG/Arc/MetJ family transcriptional regulator
MKYKNINIAFPEDILNEIDNQSRIESRTRSELIRESVRVYLATEKWKKIREYGERKRYELGLVNEEQVEDLIDGYRNEKNSN